MQPEHKLSLRIMAAIRDRGAWCFKVHGGPMQPPGIPDIIGVYKGLFIGIETKMPGGTTSEIQDFRIGKIRQARGLVVVAFSIGDATQMLYHIDRHHHGGVDCDLDDGCPYAEQ